MLVPRVQCCNKVVLKRPCCVCLVVNYHRILQVRESIGEYLNVYNICLIRMSNSVSAGATNKSVLKGHGTINSANDYEH